MKTEQKEFFDTYALNYDEVLNDSLSVSGLTRDYFASSRVAWLKRCLSDLHLAPRVMMDYGCGTGLAIPYLANIIAPTEIIGVDVSAASLTEAKRLYPDSRVRFHLIADYESANSVDGVYCSCVFHHIPVTERLAAFKYIHRSLKPGGVFSLWEHNPWNPATRYIVSRCEFDQDAVLLYPSPTKKLLMEAGFEIIGTHYLFIFPAFLKALKPLENFLSSLPLGAQYQLLCRKK